MATLGEHGAAIEKLVQAGFEVSLIDERLVLLYREFRAKITTSSNRVEASALTERMYVCKYVWSSLI